MDRHPDRQDAASPTTAVPSGVLGNAPQRVSFADVAASIGVTLRNVSGSLNKSFIIETTGSGGCFLDFDLDDDIDLYLVNGASLETWRENNPARNALYRNDGGLFVDVTESAGVGDRGWGGGCTVADYDNDGDPDVYVTNYGPNVLYRNEGNGRFTDVTGQAGVGDTRWGAGAAFADIDGDGNLDLYVANYVEFDAENLAANPTGCSWKGVPVMCGPRGFSGQSDVLFRNNGNGTFRPVSEDSGIAGLTRFGLGVVAGDVDADGDIDFYVANDSQENMLLLNRGAGRFDERGLIGGVALSGDGRQQAGMGVDLGDYDGDGDEDLFVTNFSDDYHTLYRNEGGAFFSDESLSAGLAGTRSSLGWGGGFIDYDNDGDLDVFVASGHVYPQVDDHDPGTSYRQRNLLFENEGGGRFRDVSTESGPGLLLEQPSRGVVFGDFDDDGDLDIVIVNENDLPAVLRNEGGNALNWLKVRLVGSSSNRDGIGARIRLEANGREQFREHRHNAGYYSSHDPRLHFGLGRASTVERLSIVWPSGTVQSFTNLPANRLATIHEDRGIVSVVELHHSAGTGQGEALVAGDPHRSPGRIAVPRAAGRETPVQPDELHEIQSLIMHGTDRLLAGRYGEAISAYERALDRMPKWEQAADSPTAFGFGDAGRYRRLLSGIYDNMGVAFMRAEQLDACEEAIALAIQIWPQRAKYHHNLGLCHFHARRHAEAIDALRVARKLDPNRSEVFYDLGRALVMAGHCDEAEEVLQVATAKLPTPDLRGRRAESWYFLGSCHAEAGRHGEAAHAYRETLALVPGHQRALYKLGQSLRQGGQDKAANDVLTLFQARQSAEEDLRAAKLARVDTHAQLRALAGAYLAAGQPQAAVRELRTALGQQPDDVQALHLLGKAVLSLRPPRTDMAEKAFDQVLRRNPQDVDALAGLAETRIRQQRMTEAAEWLQRALEVEPGHRATQIGLARVAAAEGRGAEAAARLTSVLEADPEDAAAVLALAEIYVTPEAGAPDPAEALRLLDGAVHLYGEDVEIRVRALAAMGRPAQVREVLSESPFLSASQRDAFALLAGER